jgi:hypothetical protein
LSTDLSIRNNFPSSTVGSAFRAPLVVILFRVGYSTGSFTFRIRTLVRYYLPIKQLKSCGLGVALCYVLTSKLISRGQSLRGLFTVNRNSTCHTPRAICVYLVYETIVLDVQRLLLTGSDNIESFDEEDARGGSSLRCYLSKCFIFFYQPAWPDIYTTTNHLTSVPHNPLLILQLALTIVINEKFCLC